MKKSKSVKANKANKAKKATKRSAKSAKPTKAKQEWLDEQKKIMEGAAAGPVAGPAPVAGTAAVDEPLAAVVQRHYGVGFGGSAHPLFDDVERAEALKETFARATAKGGDPEFSMLHGLLNDAHERLMRVNLEHEEKLAKAKEEADKSYEQAHGQGQENALTDVLAIYGKPFTTVDAAFEFLRIEAAPIPNQQSQIKNLEHARDVVAEQCKLAERTCEAALSAAKAARTEAYEMRTERNKLKAEVAELEPLARAFHAVATNDFDFATLAEKNADGWSAVEEAARLLGLA